MRHFNRTLFSILVFSLLFLYAGMSYADTSAPAPRSIAIDQDEFTKRVDKILIPPDEAYTLKPYSLDDNTNRIDASVGFEYVFTKTGDTGTATVGQTTGTVSPDAIDETTILIESPVTDNYQFAQKPIVVKVAKRADTPSIGIDYIDERLKDLANAKYFITGIRNSQIFLSTDTTMPIPDGLLGMDITIIMKSDGSNYSDSLAQTLHIPRRPSLTGGVKAVNASSNSAPDGKLTGVDALMEYSADNGKTWKTCPSEGTVSGLAVGDYVVRIKASSIGENFVGESTLFTIGVTSGGDPGDPNPPVDPPVTPSTPLDKAEDAFNDKNPDAGVRVEFPADTITNPNEVAGQLDGLKPVIVGNTSVSSITLTPGRGSSQTGAEGLTGFGKGWGAKIEVQLKVTPKQGEVLLLPVALTFALSQADLALENLTADQVVADVSALLAKAIFAKFPAEGTDKDTLQNLTDLLKDVIKVTADGNGGISIRLPFLLANGEGTPKLVVDGAKKHLVIFDGERNGWLRDPIYIFRKPAAFDVAGLVASPSSPKAGDKVTLTAAFSVAADEATITVTPPGGSTQDLTTTLASNKLSASASFTADTAGGYTAAVSAKAGSSTQAKSVTVTVREADEEEEETSGSGSSGCSAGPNLGLLLCGATLLLAAKRKR